MDILLTDEEIPITPTARFAHEYDLSCKTVSQNAEENFFGNETRPLA